MRKYFNPILLVITFGVFSCKENRKEVIEYYDQDKKILLAKYEVRSDSFWIHGIDTVFLLDGNFSGFNREGETIARGKFKNGIQIGKWTMSGEFFGGRADVQMELEFSENMTLDILDSLYRQKIFEETYSDGIFDGLKFFNKSGLTSKGSVGGLIDGEILVRKKDKNRLKTSFLNGLPNGMVSIFNEEGSLSEEISYKNGIRNGIAKSYFEDGQHYKTIEYNNGEILSIQIEQDVESKPYQEINNNGRVSFTSNKLKNGNLNGDYVGYDDHGNIIAKGSHIDGEKNGEWKYYKRFYNRYNQFYPITSIRNYSNGKLNGLSTVYWASNGDYSNGYGDVVNYSEEYKNGKRHGLYTKYCGSWQGSSGIAYTQQYLDDEKVEGSCREYNNRCKGWCR